MQKTHRFLTEDERDSLSVLILNARFGRYGDRPIVVDKIGEEMIRVYELSDAEAKKEFFELLATMPFLRRHMNDKESKNVRHVLNIRNEEGLSVIELLNSN